jgi:hypothetical protein
MFSQITQRPHIISERVLIVPCQDKKDCLKAAATEALPLAEAIKKQNLDIHSIQFQCPDIKPRLIPLEEIFKHVGEQTKKQPKRRNRKSQRVYRVRQNRTITEIPGRSTLSGESRKAQDRGCCPLQRERLNASLLISTLTNKTQKKVALYPMEICGDTLVVHCEDNLLDVVGELYPAILNELWWRDDITVEEIEFRKSTGKSVTFPICYPVLSAPESEVQRGKELRLKQWLKDRDQ